MARARRREPLRPGDIIIQYWDDENGPAHSLIWGDDAGKPVIHNADGGKFNGVIQQSVGVLKSAAEPNEYDGKPPYRVYRLMDETIAASAADFAEVWATRTDAPEVLSELSAGHTPVRLATPYSSARLTAAGARDNAWSLDALFRAIRSAHRGRSAIPLSRRKGVSCSQFVTYCYQAAVVRHLLSMRRLHLPWSVRAALAPGAAKHGYLDLGVSAGLTGLDALMRAVMPSAFLVDAKVATVDRLEHGLRTDPLVRFIGYVVTDSADHPTRAEIEHEDFAAVVRDIIVRGSLEASGLV